MSDKPTTYYRRVRRKYAKPTTGRLSRVVYELVEGLVDPADLEGPVTISRGIEVTDDGSYGQVGYEVCGMRGIDSGKFWLVRVVAAVGKEDNDEVV